ncbi:UvrD-helicase domain-containing protein [Ignavibacterium sp.]|uniref:UvrD-helicase domain-containing protein n=1 Tax=Ignavibacterium sp. TaxID=2651167 RepID=UPI00307E11A0
MTKSELLTPHQMKAVMLDDHLALTANAGSGKTFVLSRKYLEAAIKLDGKVTSIAAITFTEKAASELYQKISKLIEEEIEKSDDKERIRILKKIRRNLVSAYISTIHSFCIDILREFPVEAGVDANFTPIDQSVANELLELAVEETINDAFLNPELSDVVKNLIRYFNRRSVLQREIINLIEDRKNVLKLKDEIYSKSDEEIIDHFRKCFDETFKQIWNYFEKDLLSAVKKINKTVIQNNPKTEFSLPIKISIEEYESDKNQIKLINNLENLILTKSGTVRKQKYLEKDLSELVYNEVFKVERILEELKIFSGVENDDKYPELVLMGRNLLLLFENSLQLYEAKKKEQAYIDFEDILIHTKELLKNSDVQSYLSKKFKYLMVDEFQDTNEVQYEIFLPIIDYLKSGKLFIVGDEKQSIYKFRDAEIEIFDRTKSDIVREKDKSHIIELPDSFRMNDEICLFTNIVFNNLFSENLPLFGELKNVPIVCAKKEKKRKGEVGFLISYPEEDEISQAELVAKKIIQLVSNDEYQFGDITILVRKRKSFDELEDIFVRKNIPYSIIGGRGFYQRQVISDIYNYLTFLLNQDNDAALVGILRSPFFTVPDTKLFEISLLPGKSFYDKLKNVSDENYFIKVKKIIERHIELSSSLQLTQLINRIYSETDYLAIIKNRIDGQQELANIQKLISLSRNFDGKGFRNLYDFVSFLDDSIRGEADEPQAAISEDQNAVQMMTIHQAKGLEFPVVFIYKADEYVQSVSIKSKSVFVNKQVGLLAKIQDKSNPTGEYLQLPITVLNDFIEKKKNLAEIKRLLYVAVTRAQEKLYISVELKKEKEPHKESFIYLLKEALQCDFNESITVEDNLDYLVLSGDKFINKTSKLKIEIPVIHNLEVDDVHQRIDETHKEKEYLLNKYPEKEKSQIISATKISIYAQCPLKYHLTYNLGFALLSKILPNWKSSTIKSTEFQFDEESLSEEVVEREEEINSVLKSGSIKSEKIGELIHKVLQLELNENESIEFLKNQLKAVLNSKKELDETISSVNELLINFRNSEIFAVISQYKDYRNEFEIYLKQDSYFLHGIIDKIIFAEDKILIIDYKTDEIDKQNASSKFREYSNQLKFYLYISSYLFKNYDTFEARLIFLRKPDLELTIKYSSENITELKKEISGLIEGIVLGSFPKNLNHCDLCKFSTNEKCIVN